MSKRSSTEKHHLINQPRRRPTTNTTGAAAGLARSGSKAVPPTELPEYAPLGALPRIIVNTNQLRDVTAAAMFAIRRANTPPTLFQRGGVLTRIRTDEHGAPWLDPLDKDALGGHLARVADWLTAKRDGLAPTPPPTRVVADVQSIGHWHGIPMLNRIVEAPTFSPDGSLLTKPGYDQAAQLWFHASPGFSVPDVNPIPSAPEIKAAVETLQELLTDFPFQDDASRAHAFAAMLLPFARDLIDGLTPLHLITAPTPGTGKGLLAEVVSIPAIGRGPDVMTEGRDDDEWRKRITAALVKGSPFLLIDNIRRRLDAAALAGALTATPAWQDRILGKSLIVTLPVRVVWLATGNNVVMSHEMSRRTVMIRIDAKVENPWLKEPRKFRHPDLSQWARANRSRLVYACLTLIQGWIAKGRPTADASLGRFEQWAEIIGGILQVAGIEGFLANSKELYAEADDESQSWREFVNSWWRHYENKPVGVEDLYLHANNLELLAEVLGDGGERSKRTKLGRAMGQMRDRIIGGFRIVSVGSDHQGRKQYRLDRIEQAQTSADLTLASAPHVCVEKATSDKCLPDDADVGRRVEGLGDDATSVITRSKTSLGLGKTSADVCTDTQTPEPIGFLAADVPADIRQTWQTSVESKAAQEVQEAVNA